jgi:hypothetical protein
VIFEREKGALRFLLRKCGKAGGRSSSTSFIISGTGSTLGTRSIVLVVLLAVIVVAVLV